MKKILTSLMLIGLVVFGFILQAIMQVQLKTHHLSTKCKLLTSETMSISTMGKVKVSSLCI